MFNGWMWWQNRASVLILDACPIIRLRRKYNLQYLLYRVLIRAFSLSYGHEDQVVSVLSWRLNPLLSLIEGLRIKQGALLYSKGPGCLYLFFNIYE